ncbi:DUF317 domain-containing protein [Streptomyces sp. NPDC048641]|uniref:DUF317 domain-containing protein n=1 Tax=Streptomyces sp. NPDC048641 TaxID=3154825 RepID=UPI00342AA4DF
MVRFEYVGELGLDHWFITVTDGSTSGDELWGACLDGTTPPHLVAALTRALTDGTPVIRDPSRMPGLGVRHRHEARQQVPVEDVAFALENRIRHLAGRHPQPSTPPAKPSSLPRSGRTP